MHYLNKTKEQPAEIAEGILNCIPANIALINNRGEIITVNQSWKQFANENDAPVNDHYLGANYLDICMDSRGDEEEDGKRVAKGIKSVLDGQSDEFALEYPCHSETEERWFRLFVTPFSFLGQRCAVVMHINITKTVLIEEILAQSEVYYKTIINNASDAIFVFDSEGNILNVNDEACRRLEYGREILMRMNFRDLCAPESVLVLDQKIMEVRTEGSSVFETCLSTRSGSEVHLEFNTKLIEYRGKTCIVSVGRDITLRKQNELALQSTIKKEKELNELKSRFISTASHEFRTPLTSILASADLLEMFGREWPEQKYMEHIGKIQKGVDFMRELMDEVLIISRNEEGKTRFTPEKTDLFRLLSELFENSKTASNGKHKFSFLFRPEHTIFTVDVRLITHIVSNLLSNAVKYSVHGGEITMEVRDVNNELFIDVTDEGIGIPEEDRKRLFEPFFRADNTISIHGTGLGMSIVKRSVELHCGRISVKSEENRGTSVHVVIPYNILP